MDPEFSDAGFVAAIRAKRTEVKRALLDQTLISGVGNIYADEALWRGKPHYPPPTQAMTRPAGRPAPPTPPAGLGGAPPAGGGPPPPPPPHARRTAGAVPGLAP